MLLISQFNRVIPILLWPTSNRSKEKLSVQAVPILHKHQLFHITEEYTGSLLLTGYQTQKNHDKHIDTFLGVCRCRFK